MADGEGKARRLNRTMKRARAAADAALFVGQYGRKRRAGLDPNDRRYDRELEEKLSRIDAVRFDQLLRDHED
jgi:hypothetical protein